MATFTLNTPSTAATTTLSKLDLSAGPHTLTWREGQTLYLQNGEVSGDLTVNLLGDGVTTSTCEGYGTITLSAGLDVAVTNGDVVAVYLTARKKYLGGAGNSVTVTITGATAGLSFGWLVG